MNEELTQLKVNHRLLNIGYAVLGIFQRNDLPFLLCSFNLETHCFELMSNNCKRILGYEFKEMEGMRFEQIQINKTEIRESYQAIRDIQKGILPRAGFTDHYYHADKEHIIEIS